MAPATPKPLIWFLEEATPEVALLMHELESSLGGAATVQRVSYTEALRELPRKETRQSVSAVVVFSLPMLTNLSALVKGGSAPKLIFFPPNFQALADVKPAARWPAPVAAVARHLGEAKLLEASGFKPEQIVRLQADVSPAALPDKGDLADRPLRVGLAWYNLAPAHRERLATEIARWQQSAPGRSEWHVLGLPEDELPQWEGVALDTSLVTADALAARGVTFDVLLSDPWWPDALPRPVHAPVTLFLPPAGAPGEFWNERLQALIDLTEQTPLDAQLLLSFRYQPLWRHLFKNEERSMPELASPDLGALEAVVEAQTQWLAAHEPTEDPDAQAYYFWRYDFAVQARWCLDLWRSLDGAKNGKRHALLAAFNALPLHHTGGGWLFKRLMAATPLGEAPRARRFSRRFWWRFAWQHRSLVTRWVRALWRCGKDDADDPLAVSREVASTLLTAANVTIVRRNEPTPEPGVPTIYLMSHRHADLDPFLLLHVLPGALAVVVGPRAQRWPLMKRLDHHSAFVLTGRERGVVIADAIAAVRARRALALYPEVAEPTYLGEGAPLRHGLLWIVQALERSQVIPVMLDDSFTLGPEGGQVDLWFGQPIPCTPETGEALMHQVRAVFHAHMPGMSLPGTTPWRERRVAEAIEREGALES